MKKHSKFTPEQITAAKRKGSERWLAFLVKQGRTAEALSYAAKAGMELPRGEGVTPATSGENVNRSTPSPKIVANVDTTNDYITIKWNGQVADVIKSGIAAASAHDPYPTTVTVDSAKTDLSTWNIAPKSEPPKEKHDPLDALKHNKWGEMDTFEAEVVRVPLNARMRVIRFEQGPEAILWVSPREWKMTGWKVWVKVNPDVGYGGYVMVGRYSKWGDRLS